VRVDKDPEPRLKVDYSLLAAPQLQPRTFRGSTSAVALTADTRHIHGLRILLLEFTIQVRRAFVKGPT